MSGSKNVTIGRSEYQRLQAAEARLRTVQQDLPQVLASNRRQSSEELQSRLSPLEQRQRDFQSALGEMSNQVSDVERRTAQRLEQHHRAFREGLHRAEQRLHQDLHSGLAAQEIRLVDLIESESKARQRMGQRLSDQIYEESQARQHMGEQLGNRIDQETEARQQDISKLLDLLDQESQIRQSQIDAVQEQLNTIAHEETRKEELAKSSIKDAELMQDFIERHYRHQKFAPSRLSELAQQIRQAQIQHRQGVYETAIGTAHAAYRELSKLRMELDFYEREWQLRRGDALDEARKLLAIARSNRVCKMHDGQGNEFDVEVEVDWWSKGALSELEDELQSLVTELDNENADRTTEELRSLVGDLIPDLDRQREEIVAQALSEVFGSQARANIAQLVVEELRNQGYALQGTTYEEEDMRNGFAAKVRDLSKSEVVILVEPVAGEPGQNTLQIHSYDEVQRTDHERIKRAQEIADALAKRDLDVGPVQKAHELADPALRELENLKRSSAQTRQKSQDRNTQQSNLHRSKQGQTQEERDNVMYERG